MTEEWTGVRAEGALEESRERLFIAVPCPEELHQVVAQYQQSLGDIPGLRLLAPEQLHVTLAFIGSATTAVKEQARSVVRDSGSLPAGTAILGELLPLPAARRARVVAIELEDSQEIFASLFERVMGGLEQAGVMRREKRPFRPHLTIARLRQPARIEPKTHSLALPFAVESVCLYRSELRREGARYTVIERAMLAPAPSQ